MTAIHLQEKVPEALGGARFDQIAAELFPDFSRSRLQAWIKSGELRVDGKVQKPRAKLFGGEWLEIETQLENNKAWQAQDIALDIVSEDEHLLVINKPAGLVVHPAAGHTDGTLLNAILHHVPDAAALPRAGIVHRLDKDTSGIMVVAKSLKAHAHLVEQLQDRSMGREYQAVVMGQMIGGGTVDEPIGRHSQQRKKMAVIANGKEAVTHYSILQRFREHTHLQLKLETGRTHQIRVHMTHIYHPLVGDPVYGGRLRLPKGATPELADYLRGFKRQALHAQTLRLFHPATEEPMEWSVSLPEDMETLLELLEQDNQHYEQSDS